MVDFRAVGVYGRLARGGNECRRSAERTRRLPYPLNNMTFSSKVFSLLPSLEPEVVNERKFYGGIRLLPLAKSVLDAQCIPDGEFPYGTINSIYYDTPRMDSYYEKANGDNLKTKIRVRWYSESAGRPDGMTPVFVEAKMRIGSARRKFRLKTEAPSQWLAQCGLADPSFEEFMAQIYERAGMPEALARTPTVCISYSRLRYVCPLSGSRVALDWNISAPRFNSRIFPAARSSVNADSIVCEFKNQGGAAPPWAKTLTDAGFKFGSFSKYGECIGKLQTGTL